MLFDNRHGGINLAWGVIDVRRKTEATNSLDGIYVLVAELIYQLIWVGHLEVNDGPELGPIAW